jgi:Arc-like DNA binding domain
MATKRIGRPPKSVQDRKAVNFTFRSRGEMRERLQSAAANSRRSISEEIEYRLDQSFQRDDFEQVLGQEQLLWERYGKVIDGIVEQAVRRAVNKTAAFLRGESDELPVGPARKAPLYRGLLSDDLDQPTEPKPATPAFGDEEDSK